MIKRPLAEVVRRSILLNNTETHLNIAWVIMPNHVHLLIKQWPGFKLGNIVKQIKGGSAHNLNKALGRSGKVWQIGYFDRLIRSPLQLRQTVDYIHENPVKARLVSNSNNWSMSSCNGFEPAGLSRELGLPESWYEDCASISAR